MTVRHPPTALQDPIALDALADLDSTAADQWLAALTQDFAASAGALDREAIFPHDNLARLRSAGLLALTVPQALGGRQATLPQALKVVRAVARGEPSTALILVMQCLYHLRLQANPNWPQALKEQVARDAVENGALINSLRVEPELGSPSRGGLPGRNDEAIKTSGDISASRTPRDSNSRANQRCGVIKSCIRPRDASSPSSHALIGEI